MKSVKRGTKRLTAVSAVVATTVAAALSGCGVPEGGGADAHAEGDLEDMETVTIKVSTQYGPEHMLTKAVDGYVDAVEESSKGKIEFEMYYGGSLAPPEEQATGLRDGLIDMSQVAMAYTPSAFPYDTWITKAGYLSESNPVSGALQGAAATLDWGINNSEYMAEFTDQGLVPLLPRIQTLHKYNVLCSDQADTLDEMKGKRMRVGGEAWAQEAENIGAVPVSMTGNEVYTSFQQGLIDCFLGSLEDVDSLGLYDHGKYFITTNMTAWTSAALLMSEDAWSSLPLDAQQLMWDQLPAYLETLYEADFSLNMDIVQQNDSIEFVEPGKSLQRKIDDYHASLPDKLAEDAPPEVSDAPEVIQSYVDIHDKWWNIVTGDLGFSGDYANWRDYVAKKGSEPIELNEWAQRVYDDVLKPHRPE